jgi:hypothetical protein
MELGGRFEDQSDSSVAERSAESYLCWKEVNGLAERQPAGVLRGEVCLISSLCFSLLQR